MVESTSTVSGPSPGPAPAAHALARIWSVTLSSWRTWPKVKARSQVPTVEAAITRWPSTLPVAPERSSSTSSMQSPPATSACTNVSSLRPGWAAPGRSPRSTSWLVACSTPSRSASVAGSSSPAEATACSSSKAISTWSSTTWEDGIEKVSSESGIMTAWQPSFSLVRGPFSYSRYYRHCPQSVDPGSDLSALLVLGQVEREDAGQDQQVVLAGGDVHRIGVAHAEPAFGDGRHRLAA